MVETKIVAARIDPNSLSAFSFPAGTVLAFGGVVAPSGYLLCDGSSYATSSYPNLFSVIGYTYGGSGANFNVPDCRSRSPFGAGTGAGLTTRVLGTSGGSETHTHVINSHTHTFSNQSHSHITTHSHTTTTAGFHDHQVGSFTGGNIGLAWGVPGASYTQAGTSDHSHTLNLQTITTGTTVGTLTNASPTTNAISHVNPFIAVNFMVKT